MGEVRRPVARRVREYLAAMGADAAADALFYLTLAWVAAHSGGAVSAGVVLAAGSVPQLAMMLLGGAAGDRFGLVRTAGATLAIRTGLFAVFVVMLASGSLSLWPLVAMSAAVGLVDALHMPAMGGVAGLLADVGEQASVQGSVSATTRVSGVAATTVGGVLLAWSLPSAGVVMVVLSVVALMLLLVLRRSSPAVVAEQESGDAPGLVMLMREGLATVGRDRHIRLILVLFTLANLAATAPVMLGIPLKGAAYSWSAVSYGLAMVGFAAGSALGAVAIARWGKSVSDNVAAAIVLLIPATVGLGALSLAREAWQASISVFFVGLALAPAAALLMGEVRERVPASHMGRVSSIVQLAIFGLIPVGHLLFGWMVARWNLGVAGATMAGALAVTVVVGAVWRRVIDRSPVAA